MNKSITLAAEITGNVTAQPMLISGTFQPWGGGGLEAGVDVLLGTATSVDVTIVDAEGRTVYTNTTITNSESVAPSARTLKGGLFVTTANISNAAHTLKVLVGIRT